MASESDSDCVHTHPVPPEEVARYSPIRDLDSEQDIARYVAIEASDETVLNAEKIRTDHIGGDRYDIWDVATDKGKWWVITNLTNLYSQSHFPSLDYTLSFHIGLMMRLKSRSTRIDEEEHDPFDEVSRRWDQASDRFEQAVEVEDFQAVGMLLRESLLTMISVLRRRLDDSLPDLQPKAADFKAWIDLMIGEFCPGDKQKELRSYLKNTAEKTWSLVNWLTHYRDANKTSTSITIQAVDTLFGHLINLTHRDRSGSVEKCPQCASQNLRSHFDPDIEPDGDYYASCGACRWSNHPKKVGPASEEAGPE